MKELFVHDIKCVWHHGVDAHISASDLAYKLSVGLQFNAGLVFVFSESVLHHVLTSLKTITDSS